MAATDKEGLEALAPSPLPPREWIDAQADRITVKVSCHKLYQRIGDDMFALLDSLQPQDILERSFVIPADPGPHKPDRHATAPWLAPGRMPPYDDRRKPTLGEWAETRAQKKVNPFASPTHPDLRLVMRWSPLRKALHQAGYPTLRPDDLGACCYQPPTEERSLIGSSRVSDFLQGPSRCLV